MTEAALTLTTHAPLTPALEAAAEQAARHVRERRSGSSRRTYARAWSDWSDYCAARCIATTPIHPAELITYLTKRSREDFAPNTVRLHLYALSVLDVERRVSDTETHPLPVRAHPLVVAWLDGWRREHKRRPINVAPALTVGQVEDLIRAAAERPATIPPAAHVATYARDRCMMLLCLAAALRVSELVSLEMADVTLTDRGLSVLVRTSKTDQEGRGHVRGVMPQGVTLRCPVDAWRAWLRVRGTEPGPLFVAINRDGTLARDALHEANARKMIKRHGARAGLKISSHSFRATFATLASTKRKPINRIADHGGWSSLDVLRGYVRQGELFVDSPSSGLLDD